MRKKEAEKRLIFSEGKKKRHKVKICILHPLIKNNKTPQQFIKHYGGAKQKNSGGRGRVSGSVRRFERGEHGDVDRGISLFLF